MSSDFQIRVNNVGGNRQRHNVTVGLLFICFICFVLFFMLQRIMTESHFVLLLFASVEIFLKKSGLHFIR